MSAFVANPPSTASAAPADGLVANDGWFPDVSLADTREILSIGTAVTDARLRAAVEGGMLTINRQLVDWRAPHQAANIGCLADTPADRYGDGARRVTLYLRAVRAEAAAELATLAVDLSATDKGRDRGDALASPADDHRRIALHCVRDILGRRRTRARLV